MDIVFPTTGSAVIELKQPDYNILQLAKQVDSAVKTRQDQDAGQLGQDPHSELGGSHKHNDEDQVLRMGEQTGSTDNLPSTPVLNSSAPADSTPFADQLPDSDHITAIPRSQLPSTSGTRATQRMAESPSSRNDKTLAQTVSSPSSEILAVMRVPPTTRLATPPPPESSALPDATSTQPQSKPKPSSLVHLHSHSLEIILAPPCPHETDYRGDRIDLPNPDRERFDQILSTVQKSFPAARPFTLLPMSDKMIQVPAGALGNIIRGGFHILAPSNLKRWNVIPFLKHVVHPNTQSSAEWFRSSTTWDTRNWIHAACSLDPKQVPLRNGKFRPDRQKIYMESEVKCCWVEEDMGAENAASLRLILDIEVYLDAETIFEPASDISNDLMGFIFHSLIPSPTTQYAMSDSERRADSLRHFFASIRPAPPIPYARSFQPAELVSKLLPFQNRTVALLAQRERGVAGTSTSGPDDPRGFWSTFELGALGKVAFRRLTGEIVKVSAGDTGLSEKQKGKAKEEASSSGETLRLNERQPLPALVDLSEVRGTMLCEEMGLGKTVESVALMFLNRHPLSTKRIEPVPAAIESSPTAQGSPSKKQKKSAITIPTINLSKAVEILDPEVYKWWRRESEAFKNAVIPDRGTGGNVSQVAATLIVTPPSLLKQWVAEMATHAPSLRVCVYTGWKSLLDGVAKRVVSDRVEQKNRLSAKRKKDNDRQRANTVRKYQKTTRGKSIKIEPEDVSDSENEEPPVEDLQQRTQRLFVDFVRAHDVVIATYPDMSKDFTVALPTAPRARRSNVNYQTGDRPRSPLVMVEWWRVIMDEVQLCGDSSASANMVSLIPRQLSLAVSGTPARTDIKDLLGSVRFLRVPEIPHDPRLWHRLQQPPMRPAFDGLFQSIAIRTTKKEVAGEFELPHQTRMIVPIELSEIEMHYYNDTLERQRVVLGLPADPTLPRPDDWHLEAALFRGCLRNLRQICTHIQVGQMAPGPGGRRGGRLRLGRELLTLSGALSRISEDHEAERLLTARAQFRAMIRKATALAYRSAEEARTGFSMAEDVRLGIDQVIQVLYERVREKVIAELEPIRLKLDKLLEARDDSLDDVDEESEKDLSQQDREHVHELQHIRTAIRELLLILHQSWFFEGDYRHVKKETEAEVKCYAQAEATRKEILARPLRLANASVDKLKQKLQDQRAIESVADLQTQETDRRGGILSEDPITQSNELLKLLNENALLVCSWRDKIIELLTETIDEGGMVVLTDQEDQEVPDPDKEQYAEALSNQGQVEAYLIAYSAAIADRREMMLEERTILATHEARTKKARTTKTALEALADSNMIADVADDVAILVSELMSERQALRDARKVQDCQRPLKVTLMYLNNIIHGGSRAEEVAIAQEAADFIRAYIKTQSERVDGLNKELDMFRKMFNRRVVYFAALQEISDTVTQHPFKHLDEEINKASIEIIDLEATLARSVVRSRYLKYLASREDTENTRDDCLICMGGSDDDWGILLDCGHFFCASCFQEFRRSAIGKKCPQCRSEIQVNLTTKIRIGSVPEKVAATLGVDRAGTEAEASLAADAGPPGSSDDDEQLAAILPNLTQAQIEQQQRQQDLDRLNMMPVEDRRTIASMDMMGDFGSKINFLVKHLLWYQVKDNTTRHVVFSNWSDSLRIVIQALQTNGIKFVSFDRGGKLGGDTVEEFQQDESIKVFLLHAERESAGLTLTSCSTVHLLEPVLKHSFELQAIGRVDRLGQKQETTVFCYATQDTVESRILSQGVRNGTSIYLNEKEQGDQVVKDLDNVVSAAHKGGDIGVDGNEEEMLQLIML